MHARHGCYLILHNIKWIFTDKNMSEPLLGWQELEERGLNTKEILDSTDDRLNGDIDMLTLVADHLEEDRCGTIAGVFHDRLYHMYGFKDGPSTDIDDFC